MKPALVRCLGAIGLAEPTEGNVRPLRGSVDAAVLALLTTDRRGVRIDELLETVWQSDDRSPMIQSLYRLRKRLGSKDSIVQEGHRYRLSVPVDIWRFEDLLAGDSTDSRVAALELWDGDPYEGLDELAQLHQAREHVRQLRVRAIETLALRAADDPERLLPIMWEAAASEPWNEKLTLSAMTAFATCGQTQAALDLAERCRVRLREDLDLEPSSELDTLEASIRHTQAVQPINPSALASPSMSTSKRMPERIPSTMLVEREPAMDRLERTIASARTGPGRIVLIEGPPGIGKTAAANQFIAERPDSVDIRVGGGRVGDPIAFEAVLQAFPELNDSLDNLRVGDDASVSRLLFARDVENLLHRLAGRDETIVLVEDLHAADRQTMSVLSYLAERALPARLTLILTTRPITDDPTRSAELTWISQRPVVEHIQLAPLSVAGVRQLVDVHHPGTHGDDRARLTDQVVAQSQGIPLIVDGLVRSMEPGLREDRGHDRDVAYPAVLSHDDSELLGLAALIGFSFDLDTLVRIGKRPRSSVIATLDRAAGFGVLSEWGRGETAQFRHQLIFDHFAAIPGLQQKQHTYAELARDPNARGTETLRYVRGAGQQLAAEIAIDRLAEAAAELRENLAFSEARNVLLELEALLADDDDRRLRVLTLLAECAARSSLPAEASRWRAQARPLCREKHQLTALAVSGLPDGEFVGGEPDRLALFDLAPTVADLDGVSEAFYTWCHLRIARLADDLPRVREILSTLPAVGPNRPSAEWTEVQFERLLIEAAHDGRNVHDDLHDLALSLEPGPLRAAIRHRQLVAARIEQLPSLFDVVDEIAAEARLHGSPLTQWGVGQVEIAMLLEQGRSTFAADRTHSFDETADRMIARAHRTAVRHGVANADSGLAAQTFLRYWTEGRLAEALPLVAAASADGVPNPGWMAATALAAAATGDARLAASEADRVVDVFNRHAESNWRLNAAAILTEAASLAELPDAAAAAATELRPRSGKCVVLGAGSVSLGPVDRYLGKAAALTGSGDPRPLLESAIEQADAMRAAIWSDRARADLAALA